MIGIWSNSARKTSTKCPFVQENVGKSTRNELDHACLRSNRARKAGNCATSCILSKLCTSRNWPLLSAHWTWPQSRNGLVSAVAVNWPSTDVWVNSARFRLSSGCLALLFTFISCVRVHAVTCEQVGKVMVRIVQNKVVSQFPQQLHGATVKGYFGDREDCFQSSLSRTWTISPDLDSYRGWVNGGGLAPGCGLAVVPSM